MSMVGCWWFWKDAAGVDELWLLEMNGTTSSISSAFIWVPELIASAARLGTLLWLFLASSIVNECLYFSLLSRRWGSKWCTFGVVQFKLALVKTLQNVGKQVSCSFILFKRARSIDYSFWSWFFYWWNFATWWNWKTFLWKSSGFWGFLYHHIVFKNQKIFQNFISYSHSWWPKI